jgi:selenide,water dikinase
LTVDVFTPVVDDPYTFGAIAAANSLSDVYAMGARPIAMLSFVGFPRGTLPWDVLQQMLLGGAEKAREAGVDVVGGHTIDDPEPKCGYTVVGLVHPDRVITNAGGQPGDELVLTKPLGSGILTTAIKRDLLDETAIKRVIDVMAELNRAAADAMRAVDVHACTDVTGFGLLGHVRELAAASGLAVRVNAGAVPILPEVLDLIARDAVPGGTRSNEGYLAQFTTFADAVDPRVRVALVDAQTSGGLVIAVPPDQRDALVSALDANGVRVAACIGRLEAGAAGTIVVEP